MSGNNQSTGVSTEESTEVSTEESNERDSGVPLEIPKGKRRRSNTISTDPAQSPLRKVVKQLNDNVGTFFTETSTVICAAHIDEGPYLNRLERLHRTTMSTVETLEETCDLLKSTIEKGADVNSPNTSSASNMTTTNETHTPTNTPDAKSSAKYTPPQYKYPKTKPSPTTMTIADLNLKVGAFLATTWTETTNGIKANEPISSEKKKRLNYLLTCAERSMHLMLVNKKGIAKRIETVKPGHKLPTYVRPIRGFVSSVDGVALTDLELLAIRVIRNRPDAKGTVEQLVRLKENQLEAHELNSSNASNQTK